jgi:hypothetical protein
MFFLEKEVLKPDYSIGLCENDHGGQGDFFFSSPGSFPPKNTFPWPGRKE